MADKPPTSSVFDLSEAVRELATENQRLRQAQTNATILADGYEALQTALTSLVEAVTALDEADDNEWAARWQALRDSTVQVKRLWGAPSAQERAADAAFLASIRGFAPAPPKTLVGKGRIVMQAADGGPDWVFQPDLQAWTRRHPDGRIEQQEAKGGGAYTQ